MPLLIAQNALPITSPPHFTTTPSVAEVMNRAAHSKKKILVAVIDTGIDIYHPDLRANLWTNPGETGLDSKGRDKATNGIDDDGNGFADDLHGWSFISNNNNLNDEVGHGSHVSGIIRSLAPQVEIMTIKYYDGTSSGAETVFNTVRAIEYAVKMKADIINYSGGGYGKSAAEESAIREAQRNGILFVAAAGNDHLNSDLQPFFPATYKLSNILSVAATDRSGELLPRSNFGAQSVHVAAPGQDIVSSLPGGLKGAMSGTSQATAYVTGVAAEALNRHPDLQKPERMIRFLASTGTPTKSLTLRTRYKVRVDRTAALAE